MNPKVEKRRDFLINLLYLAAILGLAYVFFKYLFWMAAPFLLTFFFAMLLQRPLRWLDKKTEKKAHTFWSIALVILSVMIIIIPLVFIFIGIGNKISDFVSYLVGQLDDIPTFLATLEKEILDLLKHLPSGLYKTLSNTVTESFTKLIQGGESATSAIDMDTIKSGLSTGISGMYSVVKNIPSVLIGIVIGFVAWIFFTKDYDKVVRFIQRQMPKDKKNTLVEFKQVFYKTILTMFRAYGLIMCITFGELLLGFSILSMLGIMKNGYFALIAAGIAIFDILPVAGSGGILIPWAIVCLVTGNYKQAIGLIIIYVVITVIRQYIEPKIVGTSLGVNPIVTLMGLYFGLKLFGFIGMFVVPITIMTLKALNDNGRISIWKTSANDRK
ncbi:MAG: sporulation integral membrane protein YtvI [Eubacterium sp.]|nr:sporulation integral membrane protein YtvI [Oscillospiraceae bacterium]MDY4607449.1 sporulation integral membrane protein YtvI [Eubacterium sp.]